MFNISTFSNFKILHVTFHRNMQLIQFNVVKMFNLISCTHL